MVDTNSRFRENPRLQKMPTTEREWVQWTNEMAKWVRNIVKLGDGSITTSGGTTISGLDEMPGTLAGGGSLPTSAAFNVASTQSAVPLTGTDAGSDATVNVGAHNVVYDGGTVSYNAGSITGLSYSTTYYVYADDATKAGGAVTYAATTTLTDITSSAGRYYVGVVTTPAMSAGDTGGGYGGGGGGFEP